MRAHLNLRTGLPAASFGAPGPAGADTVQVIATLSLRCAWGEFEELSGA
jgi:hypothetical protein